VPSPANASVVINYRRSEAAALALAEELGRPRRGHSGRRQRPRRDRRLVNDAAEHFGSHVTTVVNNALGDFSFNGDGRHTIQSIPPGRTSRASWTCRCAGR
jgi:3-oxoacyl-[acyl-carrier protein] reductase